jgi:5-carboxymethyl-2-hydroxymuconate isomerase
MPHIHLETTADLTENSAIPDILEALVERLSSFESIDSKSIKAYHTLRSNWEMGEGAAPGFAHVTVAVLDGRPLELRKSISSGMWEELRTQFAVSLENEEVQLTLELREMDRQTYHK